MSITAAIPIIGDLIDRLIPDTNARKEAKEKLSELEQRGELDLLLGQLAINKQEAAHRSLFVAGWRPCIGWTCGIAFCYSFVISPIARTVMALNGVDVETLPDLETDQMMPVLLGMLGLGGMRTYEKYKGVTR